MSDARRRGFTLLEVLVAITILGILLTTVFGSVSRTIRTKEHAESLARMSSVGREAVLRLADEMEASLSPVRVGNAVFQGVSGGSGQFLDQVRFAVSSRPPFGPIGMGRGGRVVVTYYLAEQEDLPQTYLLVRSERPLPRIGETPEEEQSEEETQEIRTLVVDNVAGLRLRYLDGDSGQWTEEWDSTTEEFDRRLPIAVEIALFLYDDNGGVSDFSTIVDLPLSTRPTPTPGPGEA
jgi:general secretion pathway protein J